jgi:beta-N-acetylhexosaminidase
MVSDLSLGELLVIDLEAPSWTPALERFLKSRRPGGIVVGPRALRSPESAAALLAKIASSLGAAPLLALEEEGGHRDPLRALLPPLPSQSAVGAKGHEFARTCGDLVGNALALMGFNTNLAPVLDLATPASDRLAAARAFAAGPDAVTDCAREYLSALEAHRVLGCGRHFPGLGWAQFDRAEKRLLVARSMAELWGEDLKPYRALASRLPLVEVSPAAYKAYDYDVLRPAALSTAVIDGLLRTKLAFGGLVLADLAKVTAADEQLEVGPTAVKAVAAGCDLVQVPDPQSAEMVRRELEEALASGALPVERVRQSLVRIGRAKKRLIAPKGTIAAKAWAALTRRFEAFTHACEGDEHG